MITYWHLLSVARVGNDNITIIAGTDIFFYDTFLLQTNADVE